MKSVGYLVGWLLIRRMELGVFVDWLMFNAHLAVRQGVGDEILEKVFRKVHVVLKVGKGHLRNTKGKAKKRTRGQRAAVASREQRGGKRRMDGCVLRSALLLPSNTPPQ